MFTLYLSLYCAFSRPTIYQNLRDDREMSLNDDKTCLFIVNFTQNHQFQPLLQIPDCSEPLDVVLETKLLGYWLTKDMKTERHVKYMLEICYKRLWAIIKLKKAGISNQSTLSLSQIAQYFTNAYSRTN